MEKQNICPKCGALADDGSVFCAKCGAKLGEKIFCQECGTEVTPGSAFCQACGAPLTKTAEKSLKTAVKETTEASEPIIVQGKARTWSRKISDLLLFAAAAILLIFPFISFVEFSGAVYNPGFNLFGHYVQYPSGYFWGIIQLLSSFEWLFKFQSVSLAIVIRAIFALGLIAYFIALSIVSFVSIITTIVAIAKGKSINVVKKALSALSHILTFCLYSSILSTNALDVKLSGSMKLALGFSILLILAAAILMFATNIKNQFVSKKVGFNSILSLFMLIFSIVCALSFIGFRCYDYYKRAFFTFSGNDISEILYVLALFLCFPTIVFGLILLSRNLKTLKRSFKEATYINYVSREEKTFYKRIWATDYKIISYAALASIFLTLSLVIFSFDVSRAVVDGYGTASNFITAIKFDFFDIIFDFISEEAN